MKASMRVSAPQTLDEVNRVEAEALSLAALSKDYRLGGPRSVWEENPTLLNVIAKACMLGSITCN